MQLSTRKLLVGLSAAGAVTAAFGTTVHQAAADSRQLSVTLAGGRVIQITVDVPPGTPLSQIQLPDLGAPVLRVSDGGAAPVAGTPPAGTTTSATGTTSGTTTGSAADGASGAGSASGIDTSVTDDSGGDGREAATKAAAAAKKRADRKERRDRTDGKKTTKGDKTDAKKARESAPAAEDAADAVAPDPTDPNFTEAIPGTPAVGVPNFFIDKFRIPPFLLPIYQAAGIQYGIRWEVLAGINEIETDYGRNLNVSSAGAEGWMQFMPATWKQYGVDANGDGKKDPYNPVDAIFAAARYLKAAGGDKNIKKAVFAYNHADWYVDSVLLRARLVNGLPPDLIGSLTGLTEGQFPVAATTRYTGDEDVKKLQGKVKKGNAAKPVESDSKRNSIDLFSRAGAPAVAVQDGTVTKVGENPRLGRFVQVRDAYGNTYTYGNLKKVSEFYPVPKKPKADAAKTKADDAPKDPKPTAPASAGQQRSGSAKSAAATKKPKATEPDTTVATPSSDTGGKERLFANPARPAAKAHGGAEQIANRKLDSGGSHSSYLSTLPGLTKNDVRLKKLKKGARVISGTILGRLGETSTKSEPHLKFEIRPAGEGSPRVDPKPILDGWKLLESTQIYRANGKNALFGNGDDASAGQVLLMSKEQLQRRVLADPKLDIYPAGRQDIQAGAIDRRVLAMLSYLTSNGLRLGISSMRSGHGKMTASGNISEHSTGNAVDIASVNGVSINGHQGAGSITESTIRLLLQLQGTMKPHQIISLMTFPGTDNTLSLPDHADHIHVGYRPQFTDGSAAAKKAGQVLKPGQWIKLIDRIGQIDNPTVMTSPSKAAIKDTSKSGD